MTAEESNYNAIKHYKSFIARKIRRRPRHGTELRFWNSFTSPRPGTLAKPTSRPSPTRPAPQSQSLSRSYGSNLPTSLTYISLSTRGSSPWRPAADMGTNQRDTSTWPSPGFSRSEGKIRTPPQLRCSSRSKPYLLARSFQGTRTLIQKRKLFPDLPTASPGHFGLPRRTLLRGPELYAVPLLGSGIGTGFPFAQWVCTFLFIIKNTIINIGFLLGLRIDWLVYNNCSHETLLHVSPPGPRWSICYYHQDLHQRRLQAGSRPDPSAHTAATLLLVRA